MKKLVTLIVLCSMLISLSVGCAAGSKGGGQFKGFGVEATYNYDNTNGAKDRPVATNKD